MFTLSTKETIMKKWNFNWNKNSEPTTPAEEAADASEPKQGRISKASDAVLAAAGKVTLLLVLVAASAASVQKTKSSYKNM